MDIQWYPGHMAKARRLMSESLASVDMIIELVDARLPFSSRNPDFDDLFANKTRLVALNKADLADSTYTAKWLEWYRGQGLEATSISAVNAKEKGRLVAMMEKAAAQKVERMAKRGARKVVRAMVTGIPNVGKSTLINSFAGTNAAKTANRPGVTRGKQLIRINPYLELLDTPGILWPKLGYAQGALYLAFTGAIKDDINDVYALARKLIEELNKKYPQALAQRYGIEPGIEDADVALESIAQKRGFIMKGATADVERAAHTLIDEFRAAKLGRITLERPGEDVSTYEQEEFEL